MPLFTSVKSFKRGLVFEDRDLFFCLLPSFFLPLGSALGSLQLSLSFPVDLLLYFAFLRFFPNRTTADLWYFFLEKSFFHPLRPLPTSLIVAFYHMWDFSQTMTGIPNALN